MCLIHDIVEIDAGDTYAYDAEGLKTQKVREEAAKERIFSLLPNEQKEELIALFDEFEAFESAESKFAHTMDNLQPLLLNDSNGGADWKAHGGYDDGWNAGRIEGEAVGKKAGRIEGKKEALLEILEEKGAVTESLKKKIQNQNDMTILKNWIQRACTIDSVAEFENNI